MKYIRKLPPTNIVRKIALSRGFTLTEMMIVLVIVSVVIVLAAPAYSNLILRTKLKSYTTEFISGVYFARSEAIKRNAPMKLCIVNEDDDGCKESGSWEEGWIVIDPNDAIIRRGEGDAISDGVRLVEGSSAHTVSFNPAGLLTPAMSMKVCQKTPEEGTEERQLTINTTGRPKIETTTTGCP